MSELEKYLSEAPIELSKPFDALVAGKFVDMHGNEVTISAKDLQTIVDNTKKNIEMSRTESGEVAGLPIDALNHDKGQAAGWIVDVEFDGSRLRVTPEWTDVGTDLLMRRIMRYFSATVDTVRKVILGGTLTNWPAVRNHSGGVLLRPIELAMEMDKEPEKEPFNLSNQINDIWKFIKGSDRTDDAQSDDADNPDPADGVDTINTSEKELATMEIKFDELTPEQQAELMAQAEEKFVKSLKKDEGETPDEVAARLTKELKLEAFSEVADLEGAREALMSNMKEALTAEYQRLQAGAGSMLNEMMKEIKTQQHIAEFSAKITGGTEDVPHAIPFTQEEVERVLVQVPENVRPAVENLLERTWKDGFTEFETMGHGKRMEAKEALPDEYVSALRKGELTLTDLESPILGLGDLSRFDISEWEE